MNRRLYDTQLRSALAKANVVTTGDYGANGLMNPEQANKFLDMMKDSAAFYSKLRHEKKRVKQGTISKLGTGSRLLRGFVEDEDNITGREVVPIIGEVPYRTQKMVLGTAISEDFFAENIEWQGFENHFFAQVAKQISVDLLDMAFNGDEDTPSSDPEYNFLRINDGYIKQIIESGNVVDGDAINGGNFAKDYFYALRRSVPEKYRNNNFRRICSDDTYTDLSEFISNRMTALGDFAIVNGREMKILDTPFERAPRISNDVIIYADPQNLAVVHTLDIKHRKTIEGRSSLYNDMRYYATTMDADFVIIEPEATAILINRGELA